MKKNIGTKDRALRAGMGAVLLLAAVVVESLPLKAVLAIAAFFSIFQAVTSWCALYAILGKNTCPVK